MKVLLVEDDEVIADAIVKTIERSEFKIDCVTILADARLAIRTNEIEMIVLDLGLPDGDGLKFLEEIRSAGFQQPVIILTARDRVFDRVHGLDRGADDYLSKPFDMTELLARLRALKRRNAGRAENSILYGPLRLRPDHQAAYLDDKLIDLPVSQFRLLQYLLEQQGRVKTKQQIIDALYRWDESVEENTIEVYISQLRKCLWKELIKTVRGIGYQVPPLGQIP